MKLDKALIEELAVHPGHPAGLDSRSALLLARAKDDLTACGSPVE